MTRVSDEGICILNKKIKARIVYDCTSSAARSTTTPLTSTPTTSGQGTTTPHWAGG